MGPEMSPPVANIGEAGEKEEKLRRFLYALIFLTVVLLGAEVSLTLLSQWGMGKALSTQYGLPPHTLVRINSFPFLVSLMRNHLGEVRFFWDGVLVCASGADELRIGYEGEAVLRDVELRMSSIIRGNLDIVSISSAKVTVSMSFDDMAVLFHEVGRDAESGDKAAGANYASESNYQVKILDEHHIYLYRSEASTLNLDIAEKGETRIKEVGIQAELKDLPLGAFLKTASMDGEKLVLHLGVPGWQGYLDPSIPD